VVVGGTGWTNTATTPRPTRTPWRFVLHHRSERGALPHTYTPPHIYTVALPGVVNDTAGWHYYPHRVFSYTIPLHRACGDDQRPDLPYCGRRGFLPLADAGLFNSGR